MIKLILNVINDLKFYPKFIIWKTFKTVFGVNYMAFMALNFKVKLSSHDLADSLDFCRKFFSDKENDVTETRYVLKLHEQIKEIDFRSISANDFCDDETFQQFLRLKWINDEVSDSKGNILNFDQKYTVLLLFLKSHGLKSKFPHKHAYILSERVANIYEYLFDNDNYEAPDIIKNICNIYGTWIASNLEKYLDDLTGNHIINNARGLSFAGKLSLNKNYQLISEELVDRYLDNLLINNFLREGSTHYHLLFCLWLTDIKLLYTDKAFSKHSSTYAKVIESAYLLLVFGKNGYQLPLIGDISPDRTPSELISFFDENAFEYSDNALKQRRRFEIGRHKEFSRDGGFVFLGDIIRVDFDGATLFMRTSIETNFNYCASHEHKDFGSVIIYLSGEPVIIDAGRPDYITSETVCPYVGPNLHNFPVQDNNKYHTKRDRFTPLTFRGAPPELSLTQSNGKLTLNIETNGDECRVVRCINFKNSEIVITDLVRGSPKQKYMVKYLVPENISIQYSDRKIELKLPNYEVKFVFEQSKGHISKENTSVEYGTLVKSKCISSDGYGNFVNYLTISKVT